MNAILFALLIWLAVSVVFVAFRILFGIVGFGLRLLWILIALPLIVFAGFVAAPLLIIGIAALAIWVVIRLCQGGFGRA
ncbi:MAG: hypothetical protein ACM3X4_03505 [Ignavibacteriales bacterium]